MELVCLSQSSYPCAEPPDCHKKLRIDYIDRKLFYSVLFIPNIFATSNKSSRNRTFKIRLHRSWLMENETMCRALNHTGRLVL